MIKDTFQMISPATINWCTFVFEIPSQLKHIRMQWSSWASQHSSTKKAGGVTAGCAAFPAAVCVVADVCCLCCRACQCGVQNKDGTRQALLQ